MSGGIPLLPSTASCSVLHGHDVLCCNVVLECHNLDAIHEPLRCGCAAICRDVLARGASVVFRSFRNGDGHVRNTYFYTSQLPVSAAST
jgi:hypothetical protein